MKNIKLKLLKYLEVEIVFLRLNKRDYWKEHWSQQKDSGHRHSNEFFYYKKAQEILFHLNGGKSLLDFGCGTADLFKYFIPHYELIIGADFSQSMLNEAKSNIQNHYNSELCLSFHETMYEDEIEERENKKIYLLNEDEKSIWKTIPSKLDRISSSQVIQYINPEDLNNFVKEASKKLQNDGKLVFFDVIDPLSYFFWDSGMFSEQIKIHALFKNSPYIVQILIKKILRHPIIIFKIPNMGYGYTPPIIEKIAIDNGFHIDFVNSMYAEYRYHAILTKK